jgi:hypothetical protein
MQAGRIMNWIDWAGTGLALAWIFAAPLAPAQAARRANPDPGPAPRFRFLVSAPLRIQDSTANAGELLREIDDPNNGDRWLLTRDESHPGGPGLLMLVSTARINAAINLAVPGRSTQASPEAEIAAPIIRTGDRVIVEENTPVVEVRLEAVAMGPALAAAPFSVRLSIGGRVVRAVAIAPGRAVFQEETQR